MSKSCLILYASNTGNTEKVVLKIRETFDKHGWECAIFKVGKGFDVKNPPFNFDDYDFLCVGSPTIIALPTQEIVEVTRRSSRGKRGCEKLSLAPSAR